MSPKNNGDMLLCFNDSPVSGAPDRIVSEQWPGCSEGGATHDWQAFTQLPTDPEIAASRGCRWQT